MRATKENVGRRQEFGHDQGSYQQRNDRIRFQNPLRSGIDKETAAAYAATADKRAKYSRSRNVEYFEIAGNPTHKISTENEDFIHVIHRDCSIDKRENMKYATDKIKRAKDENICTTPSRLNCNDMSFNEDGKVSVELTWCSDELSFKLRWREINDFEWHTSSIISGTRVRKKNLNSGNTYEFRVRSVCNSKEHGAWSESLVIVIPLIASKREFSSTEVEESGIGGQYVHQIYLDPGVDGSTSNDFVENSTKTASSIENSRESVSADETHSNLPQTESLSNTIFSPVSFEKTIVDNRLKIDTNQDVEVEGDVRKFQWSPLASKKVIERTSACDKDSVFRKSGADFNIDTLDDDTSSSFHVNDGKKNENKFIGTWMNKKMVSTESIFRKRFVWIDCHSKRLYWSKQDDKLSRDKKFFDLQVDVADVKISSDRRGFVCSSWKKPTRDDSRSQILFQLASKEKRESEVAEWVKFIKQMMNASDIATDEEYDPNEIKNMKHPEKKSRGKQPTVYRIIAPSSHQNYQHPVKFEPKLDRCVILYTFLLCTSF